MRRPAFGRGVLALAWVVALVAPLTAGAQDESGDEPVDPRVWDGPLGVHIDQPLAGVEDADHTVQLIATVSDPRLPLATLTVNGASYEVPVAGGIIDQTIIVAPGVNRVGVRVSRGDDHASDSLTWTVRGERTELMVIATWHADGEIIDLWMREPAGETCKWDHRTTEAGGRLLDMSAAAIGFGSQAFVAPEVHAGTYRIKVHFWADRAGEASQRYAYEGLMAELDAAEIALAAATPPTQAAALAERDRIAAELDRWATPDAPQVPVHVEAILFPGTEHERRFRFDRLVRRTGHLATLGDIEIDEETIRAARADVGSEP